MSLGATRCFDKTARDDPSVVKPATPEVSGVDSILDPVGASYDHSVLFECFRSDGPKIYSRVVTSPDAVQVPSGTKETALFTRNIHNTKGGMNAMPGFTTLVENGQYKLPVKVEVVGKGFHAIEPALDRHMKEGVSGGKYVVSL